MALSRKLMAGGLAAVAFMATAGAAFAAPAYATGSVNVRSGPGTSYSIVDTVRRGARLDVKECRGSWCFVEKRGPDGWVSARYLERSGRPGWSDDDHYDRPPVYRPRPPRWDRPYHPPQWDPRPARPRYPQYPHRPGSSVCFDSPSGYVCISD